MSIRIGDNVLNNGGTATFNGTNLTKIIYDGVTVWQAAAPLCVTMLNEFSGQISSRICSDGTTLHVYVNSTPWGCVRLQSSSPMSEERRVSLDLYCDIEFCAKAAMPGGNIAYTTGSFRNDYSLTTTMEPNVTCVDSDIAHIGKAQDYTSGQYDVCPAGSTLPNGVRIDYTLRIHDSATNVTCIVPWECGRTVVLS
jgi:hypothetical protein